MQRVQLRPASASAELARRRGGSLTCALLCSACLALVLVAGCTTPVGADRVSFQRAYQETDATVLNSGKASLEARLILHRYELETEFDRHPVDALKALHQQALHDDRRDLLYALAELNYFQGTRLRQSIKPGEPARAADFFLASSLYAYLFLLGDGPEPPPNAFDRRFRNACDIYNQALPQALTTTATNTAAAITLRPAHRRLPAGGAVDLACGTNAFPLPPDKIEAFLPADAFKVRGISLRNRESGLGAPLVAVLGDRGAAHMHDAVPATLFGRLTGDVRAVDAGRAELALELYSPYLTPTIEVGRRKLPLQSDLTTPTAYALNDYKVWSLDLGQFFKAVEMVKTGVYPMQSYQRGKVPVVFVHGTMSSPIWWVEMMNTLFADPAVRQHYQFWFFIYNTGNPLSYSASKLRAALQEQILRLDPDGTDPALRQMVVVGHSQGGLLAKLTATDTGDALWRTVSDQNFDTVKIAPNKRDLIRDCYFFDRLPFVKSVVFIATPHRGSYLATSFFRKLAHRFMSFPDQAVTQTKALLSLGNAVRLPSEYRRSVPSSVDDMAPDNPWLLALAAKPVAPGVCAHSIIAVKGDERPPDGFDGVVAYRSAHVDYAQSELVVHSGHSCQDNAGAIEEVRRILIEHLTTNPAGTPVAQAPATGKSDKTP